MTDSPDPLQTAKDAVTSGRRFSRGVMDSAQQIWLAGLGALARTQQEGGKFFDALVEEGVRIQEKTHAYAEEQVQSVQRQSEPWLEAARQRTKAAAGKLEATFDAQVTRTLKRMQLPSHTDIEALAARIDALTREVRTANAGAARTATKRTTTTKRPPRRPAPKR